MIRFLAALTLSAGLPVAATAATITNTTDAGLLAGATLAASSGITIQGASAALIGSATQQGTYTGFNESAAGQPTLTMPDGIFLTTGLGNFSTTTNLSSNSAAAVDTGSHAPLVTLAGDNGLSTDQNDSNVLSFDFVLDDTNANAVTATFLFASEEFPDQSITDIMGIFVNGVNYAVFPNGDLVSNQSGDPNAFFNTGYAMEWDGLTDAFTITALANGGGAVNTLSIAIADTSDTGWDSAIFFGGMKATTTTTSGGIGPEASAVPLPAGGLLLLSGLGMAGALRLRKRRG